MADSDALRQRRRKAHVNGDHHLCRHPVRPALVPAEPGGQGSEVTDPAAELRRLAGRLVAAHEQDPANAILARELRITLQVLIEVSEAGDSWPDHLLADIATPDQPWPGA